MTPNSLT